MRAFIFSTLVLCPCAQALMAAVPLLTPAELENDASSIVVGRVRAVYSLQRTTEDWENTDFVEKPFHLFDLDADIGERRNRVDEHPDVGPSIPLGTAGGQEKRSFLADVASCVAMRFCQSRPFKPTTTSSAVFGAASGPAENTCAVLRPALDSNRTS